MVPWISKGKYVAGVLFYNNEKLDMEKAEVIFSNRMLLPGRRTEGLNIPACMKSFVPYLADASSRVKFPVFHASLNPHPLDRLDNIQLADLAERFMSRMGYADQPYVVYKHADIDREHLHVVSVRVKRGGAMVNDYEEGKRAIAICRELEQEYGLHPTVAGTDNTPFEELKKAEYGTGSTKRQIASVVRNLLDRYHCCSSGEFNTLLRIFNVSHEELTGEIGDRKYTGIIYGILDDNGERVGKPIEASRIGRDVGYRAMQERYEQTKERLKKTPGILDHTRDALRRAMSEARTAEEFERLARDEKITVIFRRSQQGRITGATFIDHTEGLVVNGSRLSSNKEFTANRFHELFDMPATGAENEILPQVTAESETVLPDESARRDMERTEQEEITSAEVADEPAESPWFEWESQQEQSPANSLLDMIAGALSDARSPQYPREHEEQFLIPRKKKKRRRRH